MTGTTASCQIYRNALNEATRAYKQYRVTEHRRELEVFETSVEINETTHHLKSN